jgi:triosephosphate isomerase (TIM)
VSVASPIIAGNWKLNRGPSATREFFAEFLPALSGSRTGTVAIFPPALSLAAALDAVKDRPDLLLGVQNVFWEGSGAYTGEISAPMAAEAGASLALVGHSERRHVFGESDADTARKVHAVLDAGLAPVLCVGETLEEREAGRAAEAVQRQLEAVARQLKAPQLTSLLLAYEPVWAIGTGRTASPADASEMHLRLRHFLRDRFGAEGATIPILYGGSVNPGNAAELLDAPEIDGLLIGGASVDPGSFAKICALLS